MISVVAATAAAGGVVFNGGRPVPPSVDDGWSSRQQQQQHQRRLTVTGRAQKSVLRYLAHRRLLTADASGGGAPTFANPTNASIFSAMLSWAFYARGGLRRRDLSGFATRANQSAACHPVPLLGGDSSAALRVARIVAYPRKFFCIFLNFRLRTAFVAFLFIAGALFW